MPERLIEVCDVKESRSDWKQGHAAQTDSHTRFIVHINSEESEEYVPCQAGVVTYR